jgi:hypothetical protein
MRIIILSALFALGVGLAGMGGASAVPAGNGISDAANAASMLDQVQWGSRRRNCRSYRVCRSGPWGRRCHWENSCRRY